MPYLKIQSNTEISDKKIIIDEMTELIKEILGKPDRFIMIAVENKIEMSFAGSDEPTAFVELKSIDLPGNKTAVLSDRICWLLNHQLGIPADRVYIEFSDAPRNMFGWDGATFEPL